MNHRGLLLFLLILPTQLACLWDRDTLAQEAKGRLDAIKIIAGWFDRNPPEFCQMRLDRVSRELNAHPDFWNTWQEPEFPSPPFAGPLALFKAEPIGLIACVIAFLLCLLVTLRLVGKRRAAR